MASKAIARENAEQAMCYNCGGFGQPHCKGCPKKEESGVFIGMTIQQAEIWEDDVVQVERRVYKDYYYGMDKFAMEFLQ